jgi:hypothetical protein
MNEESIELTHKQEDITPVEDVNTVPMSAEDMAFEPDAPTESIDELREEVLRLRESLQKQSEESSRRIRELEDFNRLFPNIPITDLPESVTALTDQGVPLAAAYALYEKELATTRARADEINRKNAFLSAGKAGTQTANEFFTPDEVRSMSPRQVHENYSKIRESMTHWRNKTFY